MTMTKFSRINKQREEITMRVLEDMEKGGCPASILCGAGRQGGHTVSRYSRICI